MWKAQIDSVITGVEQLCHLLEWRRLCTDWLDTEFAQTLLVPQGRSQLGQLQRACAMHERAEHELKRHLASVAKAKKSQDASALWYGPCPFAPLHMSMPRHAVPRMHGLHSLAHGCHVRHVGQKLMGAKHKKRDDRSES